MKYNNIFAQSLKVALVGAVAGMALASCDDDKLYTTDFEETFLPSEIIFDCTKYLPVAVDMDTTLTFTVNGVEQSDKSVIFLSSDESVATVDALGTIHGVSVGEAVITCTLPVGFGPNATVNVIVIPEIIKATQVNVTNTTDLGEEGKIYVTDELQMAAEILPENHTYDRLIWSSSDPSVASVDENGLVKCLAVGTATISATTTDRSGVKGTHTIKVEEYIPVQSIAIEPLSGPISLLGGPVDLNVTYNPTSATKGSVEWTSSDESVVTVHRGVVTPVGFGSAVVTGTCVATGEKASVNVEIPEGLYIWDASNNFLGLGAATNWQSSNEDPNIENGVWHVIFPDAGTGKWRRDIKLNCSNGAMFPMHSSRPVMALRCTIPRGGNNTWDVRDSGNPKCNDGYDLPDGTRLIYIDLTEKFTGWGSGYHDFNLFQLKVADIPNGNVDKNAPYYDIYWIRTFASLDEAKAFADADATANPKH